MYVLSLFQGMNVDIVTLGFLKSLDAVYLLHCNSSNTTLAPKR